MKFQNLAFIVLSLPSIINAAAFDPKPDDLRPTTSPVASAQVAHILKDAEIIASLELSTEDLDRIQATVAPTDITNHQRKGYLEGLGIPKSPLVRTVKAFGYDATFEALGLARDGRTLKADDTNPNKGIIKAALQATKTTIAASAAAEAVDKYYGLAAQTRSLAEELTAEARALSDRTEDIGLVITRAEEDLRVAQAALEAAVLSATTAQANVVAKEDVVQIKTALIHATAVEAGAANSEVVKALHALAEARATAKELDDQLITAKAERAKAQAALIDAREAEAKARAALDEVTREATAIEVKATALERRIEEEAPEAKIETNSEQLAAAQAIAKAKADILVQENLALNAAKQEVASAIAAAAAEEARIAAAQKVILEKEQEVVKLRTKAEIAQRLADAKAVEAAAAKAQAAQQQKEAEIIAEQVAQKQAAIEGQVRILAAEEQVLKGITASAPNT